MLAQILRSSLLAVLLALVPLASAGADSYPSRPVTLVVPYGAGGPTDAVARIIAERMREPIGQSVVVENVSGANGSVGVGRVVRSAPDGYTVLLGNWPTNVVNGAIMTLPYDVLKDLDPVSLVSSNPYVIVARKDLPANTLPELIAWLKAHPDTTEGTAGPGSGQHVSGVYFQKVTGTSFSFVPYRAGSVDIIRDLAGGHIDITFDQAITALAHIKNGTVKAFAVTQKARLAAAPDIPSVDEVGAPGVYISTWFGLWVPAGTPKDVIAKLASATRTALADPGVAKKLADLGQQIFPPSQQTPDGLAQFHKAEIERWWPVIKAAGIRLDEGK